MKRRADEQKNLCGREGITENTENGIAHESCEERAEHHAEKCGKIGNDCMEGEIICSVFLGQIDIRKRCHNGSRSNAEDMLRKTDGDIKPNGVCRYKGIGIIGCCVQKQYDGKGAEPIMPGNQFFPHVGKEEEKQKISGIDAVTQRITNADILQNIGIERGVGEIEREGIGCGNQDRTEKTLVFDGKQEDIGKFCARFLCVGIFFWNQPDGAIRDRKRESDESNKNE